MPVRMPLSMIVNNEEITLEVPPTARLVDLLRNELRLTGTKISCGIGRCGACSVLMNGRLVNSCLLMAYQVNGARIETIEGVAKGELHPVQRAFLEEGAFQCGYCTPGMVLAVKALLDEHPAPTYGEIVEALSGNLCRCTGYYGVIRSLGRLIAPKKGTWEVGIGEDLDPQCGNCDDERQGRDHSGRHSD